MDINLKKPDRVKKFYLFVLLAGFCIPVFAQTETQKQFILEKQNELLSEINFEERSQPNWGTASDGQQFLLERSKTTQFGIRKDAGIKEVYESMKKGVIDGSIPKADLKVNILKKTSIDNENIFKGVEKNGRIKDEDKFWTIPVSCKIHTAAEKIVGKNNKKVESNAVYKVTFLWKMTRHNNRAELYNIKSEKQSKNNHANRPDINTDNAVDLAETLIARWEENIVDHLRNEGYVSDLPVEPKIGKGELKGRIYTRTDTVTIYIPHEWKGDKDDPCLYDKDPKDHYDVDLIFTVQFNNDLNATDGPLRVNYRRGVTVSAIKDKEKEKRICLADSLTGNIIRDIKNYAENPSEEMKSKLTDRFMDAEGEVIEVRKGNAKKVRTWTVDKYFHKLEFKKLTISLEKPSYSDKSTDSIVYPFYLNRNRHFFFGFCGDNMYSKLHLKFVDGTYVIEKITIVRHPYLTINF